MIVAIAMPPRHITNEGEVTPPPDRIEVEITIKITEGEKGIIMSAA